MSDQSKNAALTIEVVKAFAREMSSIDQTWQRAYLRISIDSNSSQTKASYTGASGVKLVNVMAHKPFFHWVNGLACELRDSLESAEPFKVALVVLSSDFSYDVKYEYKNQNRWLISKLDGASGIPDEH